MFTPDAAVQRIEDYVTTILAAAPPLSDEQRTRLAELLRPVRVSAADRKTVVAERIAELDGGADDVAAKSAAEAVAE